MDIIAKATPKPTIFDAPAVEFSSLGKVRTKSKNHDPRFSAGTSFAPEQLPPIERMPPALRKIAGRHAELAAELRSVRARLRTVEVERAKEAAKKADVAAAARALLAGKADPGSKDLEKLVAEVKDLERRRDVLTDALKTIERDLRDAIDADRDEFVAVEADAMLTKLDELEQYLAGIGPAILEASSRAAVAHWLAYGSRKGVMRMPKEPRIAEAHVETLLVSIRAWAEESRRFHTPPDPALAELAAGPEVDVTDVGPEAA